MSPLGKLRFIVFYGLSKLALIWEVKSPRWAFLCFELRYSLSNFYHAMRGASGGGFGQTRKPVVYSGPSRISTVLGDFEVRTGTQDAAIISPAFERSDWNELVRIARAELGRGREVWFVDVGANIGTFSIRLARLFPDIKIWAFEPAPENLRLLERNLSLNAISRDQVSVCPFAASGASGQATLMVSGAQPGDSRLIQKEGFEAGMVRVVTKRLDQVLPRPTADTTILLKIDVEGHETQVIDGLTGLLTEGGASVRLCIEDIFGKTELDRKLQATGFEFQCKLTPYNSWWLRRGG